MRWEAAVTCVLVAGTAVVAGDSEANKKFVEKLQGDWRMVKWQDGGKPPPEEIVKKSLMTFDMNTIIVQ